MSVNEIIPSDGSVFEKRYKRDLNGDLHKSIDLILEFKKKLSELHPQAEESAIANLRVFFGGYINR